MKSTREIGNYQIEEIYFNAIIEDDGENEFCIENDEYYNENYNEMEEENDKFENNENIEENIEDEKNMKFIREFIIDEDTYYEILENSILKCGDEIMCRACKREIVEYFVASCQDFESKLLYCIRNKVNIENKYKKGAIHIYFDKDEIIKKYKVKSCYKFVNLALKNIIFNIEFCENFYFHASRIMENGNRKDFLDNNKNYIRIYLDTNTCTESDIFCKKNKKNKKKI